MGSFHKAAWLSVPEYPPERALVPVAAGEKTTSSHRRESERVSQRTQYLNLDMKVKEKLAKLTRRGQEGEHACKGTES